MDLIISRLANLGVVDPACIVADCIDSGRLPWLLEYIRSRESLYSMEVDSYVR